jgi:hypothetical protein
MYVPQTDACSVPNSTDPVSAATITAGLQKMALVDSLFSSAQSAFDGIINRTDLNTNGWPLVTNGGVPAGPAGAVKGESMAGGKITSLKNWPLKSRDRTACLSIRPLPESVAIDTREAFAAPKAPPMQPLTTQARMDAILAGGPAAAGMGAYDFSFGWAGVGLLAAGVFLAFEYAKTLRGRR